MVILADHPLDDIFIHDGDYGHDESHILMDDLGLKRVKNSCVSLRCWPNSSDRINGGEMYMWNYDKIKDP